MEEWWKPDRDDEWADDGRCRPPSAAQKESWPPLERWQHNLDKDAGVDATLLAYGRNSSMVMLRMFQGFFSCAKFFWSAADGTKTKYSLWKYRSGETKKKMLFDCEFMQHILKNKIFYLLLDLQQILTSTRFTKCWKGGKRKQFSILPFPLPTFYLGPTPFLPSPPPLTAVLSQWVCVKERHVCAY